MSLVIHEEVNEWQGYRIELVDINLERCHVPRTTRVDSSSTQVECLELLEDDE